MGTEGRMPHTRCMALAAGAFLAIVGGEGPAAAVEGPGDAKPPARGRAALAPLAPAKPLLWNFLPPGNRLAAPAPAVRLAKGVAGEDLVFADLDGNGRFDDAGVDGWTVAGNTHVVPYESPLFVGTQEVRLEFPATGAPAEVSYTAIPIPGSPAQREALALVNELRLRNGIPPVTLDSNLSRACDLHAQYCARNGATHDEVPGKPKYTEEGARSGKDSSIVVAPLPVEAVATVYCQFFHRFSITDPGTRALGIGQGGNVVQHYVVIDGIGALKPRPWRWPCVVPAVGSTGQPREFDLQERVAPPGGKPMAGFPVTLQFPRADVKEVRAEFRAAGGNREAVPHHPSWPGNPVNPKFPDNFDTIALLPYERLDPNARYSLRVRFLWQGKEEEVSGEFATGRSADARPSRR